MRSIAVVGIVLLFFGGSMGTGQVTVNGANSAAAEPFSQRTLDAIVGDLQQEIAAGSLASSPALRITVYAPKTPATVMSLRVGTNESWSVPAITGTMLSDDGTIQQWQASVPVNPGKTMFLRLVVTRQ